MADYEKFKLECKWNSQQMSMDEQLLKTSMDWITRANGYKYSYNYEWCGRPIIQYPQDMMAIQEIIWRVKPDLIVETGVAHGGSVILHSSMMALLDLAENNSRESSHRKVIAIDIEIRSHNRKALEEHPFSDYFELIEASSTAESVIEYVSEEAAKSKVVLVVLDSNHTHEHVFEELEAYASLVTRDSYCVVFDTVIEHLPSDSFPDRSWGVGNNPKTAVLDYLKNHPEFEVDSAIEEKLLISVAPNGYLKRVN
tara:strand:- start:4 stop:765 length:762 start_codon:yes stop_codon:yes gene_type:complete